MSKGSVCARVFHGVWVCKRRVHHLGTRETHPAHRTVRVTVRTHTHTYTYRHIQAHMCIKTLQASMEMQSLVRGREWRGHTRTYIELKEDETHLRRVNEERKVQKKVSRDKRQRHEFDSQQNEVKKGEGIHQSSSLSSFLLSWHFKGLRRRRMTLR
jgi:hypothetical protein